MPESNRFRHQEYAGGPPRSLPSSLVARPLPIVGSPAFRRRMHRVGEALREAGVEAIYLVHGPFSDAQALVSLTHLGRVFPSAAGAIRRVVRQVSGRPAPEAGNYTQHFVRTLAGAINRPGCPLIPVRLFEWSSENHHVGRADAAVRLIDELAALDPPPRRVLLWGHSHGGNVLALVTNLLGGARQSVERFFRAAEIYYRWPIVGCIDIPVWDRVRRLLSRPAPPLAELALDVVTFGTPVLYGWESAGYANLLHFIHRRAGGRTAPYRATFPPSLDDVFCAAEGDYVQQLGIAGTDVKPSVLDWRARLAEHRLEKLLDPQPAERDPLAPFQAGVIVPEEGATLLVDYGPAQGPIAEHHAGHAVYTEEKWLLFHAEEVARRFYAPARAQVA